MLGWRVIPHVECSIAYQIAAPEPAEMDPKTWVAVSSCMDGSGKPRLVLRSRPTSNFAALGEGMRRLFAKVEPGSNPFEGGLEVPPSPRWVKFDGQFWFALWVAVTFSETNGGKETAIDHLEVGLADRPPSPPVEGARFGARVIDAVVTRWSDEGDMLQFVPPKDGDWEVAGETPGFKKELGARYVVPGVFGKNGADGGLYLQPSKDDERIVILTEAQMPVSPGSVARKPGDRAIKDKDIVIQSGGTN